MRNRQSIEKTCGYCGHLGKATVDHIVPQNLFIGNTPSTIPRINACSSCNMKKSLSDTHLRDLLVMDFQTEHHPVARAILNGPFARSIQRNSSHVARETRNAQLIDIISPTGLFLGQAYGAHISEHLITSSLYWITRGLHYYLTGTLLPKHTRMVARRWHNPANVLPLIALLHQAGARSICVEDGSIFEAVCAISSAVPVTAAYYLNFYRGPLFSVSVNPIDP